MALLIGLIIAVLIGVVVAHDAHQRGMSGWWGFAVFALLIVFLPMYLILRKPRLTEMPRVAILATPAGSHAVVWHEATAKFCSNCGVALQPNSRFCNGCGASLALSRSANP